MDASDKDLIALLRRDEGVVKHEYKDSLGFSTIGVGRLIDGRKGGGLSDDEIDYLLSNDIKKAMDGLDQSIPWWRNLTPARQRVLVSMAFNLGIGGLMGFKNTLSMVKAGDYAGAARGMLQSKWAGQVGDRAVRLAAMMEQGS